MLILSIRL